MLLQDFNSDSTGLPRIRRSLRLSDDSGDRSATYGSWSDEKDSESYFIELVKRTRAFAVFPHLSGTPLWKHHFQDHKKVQVDVLLLPNQSLVDAGWRDGAIAVEVKRSGERIGPGCNQLLDYLNSVFYLEDGTGIVPTWGLLFPAHQQAGPMASIMAHQHLGTIGEHDGQLLFACGHHRLFTVTTDGRIDIGRTNFGHGLGAR